MPDDPGAPLTPPAATGAAAEVRVPTHWQCLEFISDLHLQASESATFDLWERYLHTSTADAIFILGDLFEVWVGDDAALSESAQGFEARCCRTLRQAAQRRPVYLMRGNRDFLIGAAFFDFTGLHELQDPTRLSWHGQQTLLSHGDAWCLADTAYQAFRREVRGTAWQQNFLAKPLAERQSIAKSIRQHSETNKRSLPEQAWADLDLATVQAQLAANACDTLVHGHTHRPARQALAGGRQRWVLSDWEVAGARPRAQVLRWQLDPAGNRSHSREAVTTATPRWMSVSLLPAPEAA